MCVMWNEELEQRAAHMRQRYGGSASTTEDTGGALRPRGGKASTSTGVATTRPPTIVVAGLPEVSPYALLQGVWKPVHTNALLSALGDVDPMVVADCAQHR